MRRFIIGLTERVRIIGSRDRALVVARIDTGASKSSIDSALAASIGLGPIVTRKVVRSAHGRSERDVVLVPIVFGGRRFKVKFTIADRSHMKYRVLIGRNLLKRGFLIDTSKP